MEENLKTVLYIICSSGTAGLVYWGLRNYVGEKFKNIATQQDIGEITTIVESAKKTFHDDTEKLKSQLSILTNKHNILFDEERKALVDFLSAWNQWYESLKIHFKDYDTSNFQTMKGIQPQYRKDLSLVLYNQSKLELFFTDKDIIKEVYQLQKDTFELQRKNIEYVATIHGLYKNWDSFKKKVNGKQLINPQKQQQIINQIAVKMTDFSEVIMPYHNKVLASQQRFIQLSKQHIRKDLQQ